MGNGSRTHGVPRTPTRLRPSYHESLSKTPSVALRRNENREEVSVVISVKNTGRLEQKTIPNTDLETERKGLPRPKRNGERGPASIDGYGQGVEHDGGVRDSRICPLCIKLDVLQDFLLGLR